jgi:hypothetical protein
MSILFPIRHNFILVSDAYHLQATGGSHPADIGVWRG